jgi:hypothetical protein
MVERNKTKQLTQIEVQQIANKLYPYVISEIEIPNTKDFIDLIYSALRAASTIP